MSKTTATNTNTAFSKAFTIPTIPAEIRGQRDVSLDGAYQAILNGKTGATLKGKALLFAVAQQSFGGAACADVRGKTKQAWIVALTVCPLPTCKGGKDARPLTACEVSAFLVAFECAYNELSMAKPKPKPKAEVAETAEEEANQIPVSSTQKEADKAQFEIEQAKAAILEAAKASPQDFREYIKELAGLLDCNIVAKRRKAPVKTPSQKVA